MANHADEFLDAVRITCENIGGVTTEMMVRHLVNIRELGGRLFVLGIGGSSANASHAVNDFRKLCGIEAYCPSDSIAELTARVNDEGWDTVFSGWLENSYFGTDDALLILSVGGGNQEKKVSVPIIKAVELAKEKNAWVLGIVGRSDGYVAKHGDCVVVVPIPYPEWVTPITESFQSIILHCLVSHPDLQKNPTKW